MKLRNLIFQASLLASCAATRVIVKRSRPSESFLDAYVGDLAGCKHNHNFLGHTKEAQAELPRRALGTRSAMVSLSSCLAVREIRCACSLGHGAATFNRRGELQSPATIRRLQVTVNELVTAFSMLPGR